MLRLRDDVTYSVPWAMIQHLPFREQVETVASLGFQEFTLHPFRIGLHMLQGWSLRDMKALVDDSGLRIGRLDPLCAWVPDWQARDFDPGFNTLLAMETSEFLDLSAFFGCAYLSLNAMWPAGRYGEAEIVGFYRAICARAAPYGINCHIEPVPMWGIPRLEDALRIIKQADAANSGLVIDTLHVVRGGTSIKTLAEVPGNLIHAFQLSDGDLPASTSLEAESLDRKWPGMGQFPLDAMIRAVDGIDGLRGVGPEVFSSDYARDGTPGHWIVDRIEQAMRRYPQLLA